MHRKVLSWCNFAAPFHWHQFAQFVDNARSVTNEAVYLWSLSYFYISIDFSPLCLPSLVITMSLFIHSVLFLANFSDVFITDSTKLNNASLTSVVIYYVEPISGGTILQFGPYVRRCRRIGMLLVERLCFHMLFHFAPLRLWIWLLIICFVLSFAFVAFVQLLETVSWIATSQTPHPYLWSLFRIAARFFWHQRSTAFRKTFKCSKRSITPVIGKLFFQILFDFASLRSRTALQAICLWFCLFRGMHISFGDCYVERFSDVVVFYEFLYVKWKSSLVVIIFWLHWY